MRTTFRLIALSFHTEHRHSLFLVSPPPLPVSSRVLVLVLCCAVLCRIAQTLGVNFLEKSIMLRNTEVTFSIWDLGGQVCVCMHAMRPSPPSPPPPTLCFHLFHATRVAEGVLVDVATRVQRLFGDFLHV